MKARVSSLALLATSFVAAFGLGAAADAKSNIARPMFTTIPMNAPGHQSAKVPAGSLTVWSGSFKDHKSQTITFKMVGTDPTSTNTNTTVNVVVIPVIFKYGASNGNKKFNPKKDKIGGVSVLNFMKGSPIFTTNVDWKPGGTDIGSGQYVDAFQRGNWWSTVQNESNYHVNLAITKTLKPLKFVVTASQGHVITNPWGTIPTGEFPINTFDSAVNSYITSHASDITPDVFPLFISDNVYLTSGGCCIGGYHSARSGSQTYGYTTIVTETGDFSEDISALSHEVSEWMDDPFTNNHVNCNDNSILEVGDPLEGLANFGTFPVVDGGVTYHPQDEVFIGYFGYPTPFPSVNGAWSFNEEETHVCPGQ